MISSIYSNKSYQEKVQKTKEKEEELLRLLKVKSEKICNDFLTKNQHIQLSYLSKEEQEGAVALPKELILDRLLTYLRSL